MLIKLRSSSRRQAAAEVVGDVEEGVAGVHLAVAVVASADAGSGVGAGVGGGGARDVIHAGSDLSGWT